MKKILRAISNWASFAYRERRINQRLKFLESLVDVGIDLHMKEDSWAVICVGGKAEFVKFYSLGPNGVSDDIRLIQRWLRDMRKEQIIIDSNPSLSMHIRSEWL